MHLVGDASVSSNAEPRGHTPSNWIHPYNRESGAGIRASAETHERRDRHKRLQPTSAQSVSLSGDGHAMLVDLLSDLDTAERSDAAAIVARGAVAAVGAEERVHYRFGRATVSLDAAEKAADDSGWISKRLLTMGFDPMYST